MKCEICNTKTQRKWKNYIICCDCLNLAKNLVPQMQDKVKASGIAYKKITLRDALISIQQSRASLIKKMNLKPVKLKEANEDPPTTTR